jgi:hypothetical protein
MIAQDRAAVRFRGTADGGHFPFKVAAVPQGGAGQARAAE